MSPCGLYFIIVIICFFFVLFVVAEHLSCSFQDGNSDLVLILKSFDVICQGGKISCTMFRFRIVCVLGGLCILVCCCFLFCVQLYL